MTAEELNEFITDAGIDRVIADLVKRGYYVRQLATQPVLAAEHLVIGTLRMIDGLGLPLAGHAVTVETLRTSSISVDVGGQPYFVGESQSTRHFELNAEGVLALKLVKGSRVVITVSGGLSREILVPNENFNVLDIQSDDGFITPARPVTVPIRRT